MTLTNSIVAGNGPKGDVFGPAPSGSHNLIGGDPMLGPLAWNGGPTQTMALLPGSPAIGVGVNLGYTTDQRNIALDSLPDIGASSIRGRADRDDFCTGHGDRPGLR